MTCLNVCQVLNICRTHLLTYDSVSYQSSEARRAQLKALDMGGAQACGKENLSSSVVMMKYSDDTNLRTCADVCLNILDPSLLFFGAMRYCLDKQLCFFISFSVLTTSHVSYILCLPGLQPRGRSFITIAHVNKLKWFSLLVKEEVAQPT